MSETPAYGAPASVEVVVSQGFTGTGLKYSVIIVDDRLKDRIKPRRRTPTVAASDFLSSLVEADGRYYFNGVLNEWPGLTSLELLSMKVGKKVFWKNTNRDNGRPKMPRDMRQGVLAIMQAPDYTNFGYTKNNAAHIYWADAAHNGNVRNVYFGVDGVKMTREVETRGAVAVKAHTWGHRYSKSRESFKDSISYHTGVLIEWDHHQFCSIVELAWLNGIGGYNGNSNWIFDSFGGEEGSLIRVMPAAMRVPWHEKRSEIRIFDVPWKSVEELVDFFQKFEGKPGEGGRFIDPKIRVSADVKLQNATMETIYTALANYIQNDSTYSEPSFGSLGNNCQTFAAHFHSYLAGKKVRPFTRLIGPIFKARTDLFVDTATIEN